MARTRNAGMYHVLGRQWRSQRDLAAALRIKQPAVCRGIRRCGTAAAFVQRHMDQSGKTRSEILKRRLEA